MNPYQQLIVNLKEKIENTEDFLFRISMQSDLSKVKQYGSSRIGFKPKLWDKLDSYEKKNLPKYPLYHEEMIIASYWKDIEKDVLLENGTLKHKLTIYERPFFTLYHQEKLLEIGKENSLGENNQGTHFFFLDKPLEALHSLWQIKESNQQYYVEEITWK